MVKIQEFIMTFVVDLISTATKNVQTYKTDIFELKTIKTCSQWQGHQSLRQVTFAHVLWHCSEQERSLNPLAEGPAKS